MRSAVRASHQAAGKHHTSKTAYAELVRVDADGAAAYELTLLLTPEEARQAVAVLTELLAVGPGERQVAEKEFDDARPRTKAARASFGSLSTQMRQPRSATTEFGQHS